MSLSRAVHGRGGFTVMETLTAVSIGLVLLSMTVRSLSPVQERTALRSAEQAFRGLVARTRAQAIERGEDAVLRLDAAGDSAWIVRGTQRVEGFAFDSELAVDVQTNVPVVICMTPRGVADPACGTNAVMTILFQRGGASSAIQVLPLGQILGS